MRTFDAPAVPCIDRLIVFVPRQAPAPGTQNSRMVRYNMHPAGRRALGQALRPQRIARAVVSVDAIPPARNPLRLRLGWMPSRS